MKKSLKLKLLCQALCCLLVLTLVTPQPAHSAPDIHTVKPPKQETKSKKKPKKDTNPAKRDGSKSPKRDSSRRSKQQTSQPTNPDSYPGSQKHEASYSADSDPVSSAPTASQLTPGSAQEVANGLRFTVNGVSFTMVKVEGGTFIMGSDTQGGKNAKPAHRVTLSDYYIGQTEVTQALWKTVMGSNPSKFVGSDYPVERVSWYDCQIFLSKLNSLTGYNFRLPTEAQWEFANRGGIRSRFYKYSGSDNIKAVAWYDCKDYSTHPVAQKQANELGIYDMSGNVSEWCADWFDFYSSYSQTDPTGPSSGSYRVYRGSNWCLDDETTWEMYRNGLLPDHHDYYTGLRLAL